MRNFWKFLTIGFAVLPSLAVAASGDPLLHAIQNYEKYQVAAEQTGDKLPRSTKAVNQALKRLSSYEPNELGSGWIAEGALWASRNPAFVDGVNQAVKNAGGAGRFSAELETNPTSVMKISGAGNGMRAAFDNIKTHDQYYDWLSASLTEIAKGKKAKLAPVFRSVVIPRPKPGTAVANRKVPRATIVKPPLHSMGQKRNLSVAGRMMVLAAMDIAGTTQTNDGIANVNTLLDSSPMTGCLSLARQNLKQCLAASRGMNEKQFCAGEHAVGEVSGCFNWILPPNY